MRIRLVLLTSAALLILPSLAFAQERGNCPPGSWFCDDSGDAHAGARPGDEQAPAADQDQGETSAEPQQAEPPEPKVAPVTVYPVDKDGRRVIVVDRPEDVPKPPKRRRRRTWGLNLRLEGVGMGRDGGSRNAEMAGMGFSLRYRPVPHFAFDAGFDFFGGTDWAGNKRRETSFTLNGIIYFNPRNVVQVYTIGGIGLSGATVEQAQQQTLADGSTQTLTAQNEYRYFGGQLGLGLEFRLTHTVSLNVAGLGFIRGRTDDKARTTPEFIDSRTGRATNTSGGGLLRGGITFYW